MRSEAILADGITILDRMIKVRLLLSGRFLWRANRSVTDGPFDPPAQRLPDMRDGLNAFADYDAMVFLSALDPTADDFSGF